MKLSKSNKFHTCTAITDPFMAFSEGFAEHLEIVTKDLIGTVTQQSSYWDYGFDVNSWISKRDEQLRYFGVRNNRFIYHTARPDFESNQDYNNLHLDHITSSSFTPERLKSGTQMMASEGVISAIFYQIYENKVFMNSYLQEKFYRQFGTVKENINPLINLYLKILYILSKTKLHEPTLMLDFILKYCEEFSNEKVEMYETFLTVTHFSTVSQNAIGLFKELYINGKRGEVNSFRKLLKSVTEWKEKIRDEVVNGERSLSETLQTQVWVEADELITPVPWYPELKQKYSFDVNTATEIDLLAFKQMTIECAQELIKIRETKHGFKNYEDFMDEWEKITR